MDSTVKKVLASQSKYFDFPISLNDLHPFRCNGGTDYTVTVAPKGVGRKATALASNIVNNKLRCFVERISEQEVIAIAQAKGMVTVPIMPGDVASGMKQY